MYFLALPRKIAAFKVDIIPKIYVCKFQDWLVYTATLMASYNKTKMLSCNLKTEFVNIGV